MKIGVDVVDVARFRRAIDRAPGLRGRFFTADEVAFCSAAPDPVLRLAGTFAAKEAVMKVLGLVPAPAWARRIEVSRDPDGAPRAVVNGREVEISISHDGPVAVAVAVSE
jgi:holo-[acyl-carrier protein] synthase